MVSGERAEPMLSSSLWKDGNQDSFTSFKAILPMNRQSKKDGREKTGAAVNESKAQNGESPRSYAKNRLFAQHPFPHVPCTPFCLQVLTAFFSGRI